MREVLMRADSRLACTGSLPQSQTPMYQPYCRRPGPQRLSALIAAIGMLAGDAWAQQAPDGLDGASGASATGSAPLETEVVVETLVGEELPDGSVRKRFVAARRLDAGEQVYFTIRVRNPGKAPVRDVVVTKRLPYGLDYLAGSAVGPACRVEASADGGETFRAAGTAAGYTHLRWMLQQPLNPGATALLRFRAIFR